MPSCSIVPMYGTFVTGNIADPSVFERPFVYCELMALIVTCLAIPNKSANNFLNTFDLGIS